MNDQSWLKKSKRQTFEDGGVHLKTHQIPNIQQDDKNAELVGEQEAAFIKRMKRATQLIQMPTQCR
jgi:hypothetical protein